jgi:hypothetical protein
MRSVVRTLLIILGIVEILFFITFLLRIPAALALWPFPEMSPLSTLLLASFFATGAAATLWPVLMREDSAVMSTAIVYITALTPLAIIGFMNGFAAFGVVMLLGALIGVGLLLWSRSIPFRDTRPLPAVVRWTFAALLAILLIAGAQMILGRPNILPWDLTPDLSAIFGWLFLSSTVFFGYSLLRPGWANAAGNLAAFLVYDMVLLLPFVQRLPGVAPQHRISMILYVVVLVSTAVIAIYYLFINRKTRVIGS